MKPNEISVIIIFYGRHNHLLNTLQGLENGEEVPDEVILVEIGDCKLNLPEYNLDIHHVLLSDFDASSLPIATARNLGASMANFEVLAFLDVDCIPSYNYIANIKNLEILPRALYMGQPMYLTKAVSNVQTFQFTKDAILHPHRPNYNTITQTEDYGLFWSLCFFITSTLFFEIGGFDEDYTGYGAEDTDLSFKCKALGIPFFLTPYKVYHQQHAFYRPPLKSITSIINNCNRFYKKWGIWAMANHLEKFNEAGYITWNKEQSKPISLICLPEQEAIERALVTDAPFA